MKITSLDHIVLTVGDIPRSVRFYTEVLGMKEVTFGPGRKSLAFGVQKINLQEHRHELDPHAAYPTPGAIDLCFLTETPLNVVMTHLAKCKVSVLTGPVPRTGALGPMTSVYLRDPDENLIEISRYDTA